MLSKIGSLLRENPEKLRENPDFRNMLVSPDGIRSVFVRNLPPIYL